MGKQNWKPGNMLNPVPAVMVSVTDKAGNNNIITVAWLSLIHISDPRDAHESRMPSSA